jgi:hypothetical protein
LPFVHSFVTSVKSQSDALLFAALVFALPIRLERTTWLWEKPHQAPAWSQKIAEKPAGGAGHSHGGMGGGDF